LDINESNKAIYLYETTHQGNNKEKEYIQVCENSEKDKDSNEIFGNEINLTFESAKIGSKLEENLEGKYSRKRPVGLRQVVKKPTY